MLTSYDDWFVALGSEVFLGPMPFHDLRQLAETGAVLETDKVRQSGSNEWLIARDVPGLFGSAIEEWVSIPEDDASDFADFDEGGSSIEPMPGSVPVPVMTAKSAKSLPPVTKTRDLETAPTTTVPSATSPRVRVIPLPKPVTHDFEQVFPKETEAKPVLAQAVHEVATSEPITPSAQQPNTASVAPPVITTVAPSDEYSVAETEVGSPASVLTPRRRPVAFQPRTAPVRSARGWPGWIKPVSIGLSSIVIVLAGWWFWPGAESNVYQQYSELYNMLKKHRSGAANPEQWNDFVKQARAATQETIPWLEQSTKPGDRNKDLLLYVGRDLQAAADTAPDEKFAHEKRLDAFMSQLREVYGKN